MRIEWEPGLVEDAVLRVAPLRPEGRLFAREREHAYGIADLEERSRAFERLASAWFVRLGIGVPLEQALAEQPTIATAVATCGVGRPRRPDEVGAELLVRPREADEPAAATRTLRILVTTPTLTTSDELSPLLRRELLHVADMLDPTFGYEPILPESGGPGRQRLVRDRYRCLWDVTVDGRLVRHGLLTSSAATARRHDFDRTFGWLDVAREALFRQFFDGPRPTHRVLAELAAAPGGNDRQAAVCPLCGFMTAALESGDPAFPAAVAGRIHADFPTWTVADGSCPQCADLYRSLPLSLAEAARLPAGAEPAPVSRA